MSKEENIKSVKISESVHTKLKVHVAKKKVNITEFVDEAIVEKIKSDKK